VELKKWLEQNKHIKTVTRDRAGSYAKAIREALPNAIQVADRFQLHQNLLEAVKDAIGRVLPEKVEITNTNLIT
jgi:transposase